jgi:hypothetical protein
VGASGPEGEEAVRAELTELLLAVGEAKARAKILQADRNRLAKEVARLRDAIDCACNALTDSIQVSGNDRKTNMKWVRMLLTYIRPPTTEMKGAHDAR